MFERFNLKLSRFWRKFICKLFSFFFEEIRRKRNFWERKMSSHSLAQMMLLDILWLHNVTEHLISITREHTHTLLLLLSYTQSLSLFLSRTHTRTHIHTHTSTFSLYLRAQFLWVNFYISHNLSLFLNVYPIRAMHYSFCTFSQILENLRLKWSIG